MTRFSLRAALLPFGTLLTGSTIGTNNEKSTKVWTGDAENAPVELVTEKSKPSGWDIGDVRVTHRKLELPEWISCGNDAPTIPQDSEYIRTSSIFDGSAGTGDIFNTSALSSTVLRVTHIQNTQYIIVSSTNKNNTTYKYITLYRVKSGYITTNITMNNLEKVGEHVSRNTATLNIQDVKLVQDTLYITIKIDGICRYMLYIDNTMAEWKYCGSGMNTSQLPQLLGPIKIGNKFYVTYTTTNNEIHLVSSDNMETFYTNGTNTIIGSGILRDMIALDTKIIILYNSSNQYIVYDTTTSTYSTHALSGVVIGNYTYTLLKFMPAPSGKLYSYGNYQDNIQSGLFKLQFNPVTNELNVVSTRGLNTYSLEGFCCTSGYIGHMYYPEMIHLLCTKNRDYNTQLYGYRIIDTEDSTFIVKENGLETAYNTQEYSGILDNISESMFYSNGKHVSIKHIQNLTVSGLTGGGGTMHYYLKIN